MCICSWPMMNINGVASIEVREGQSAPFTAKKLSKLGKKWKNQEKERKHWGKI